MNFNPKWYGMPSSRVRFVILSTQSREPIRFSHFVYYWSAGDVSFFVFRTHRTHTHSHLINVASYCICCGGCSHWAGQFIHSTNARRVCVCVCECERVYFTIHAAHSRHRTSVKKFYFVLFCQSFAATTCESTFILVDFIIIHIFIIYHFHFFYVNWSFDNCCAQQRTIVGYPQFLLRLSFVFLCVILVGRTTI